jgi:hypothetical protein
MKYTANANSAKPIANATYDTRCLLGVVVPGLS